MPFSKTIGRVLDKGIEDYRGSEGDIYYRPFVLYEYQINGIRYTCDQVTSWQIGSELTLFAKRVLAGYHYGMQVYYDTENPEKAYLEKGAGGAFHMTTSSIILHILFFIFVVIPFFALILSPDAQHFVAQLVESLNR